MKISLLVPTLILAWAKFVTCSTHLMIRDGAVSDTDLIGYSGTNYQAIRYEPLCGTLGTNDRFKNKIDMTEHCTAAMQLFSNNSVDHLAFYDTTGVRLKNVVVGGGRDLCMCFSLAQGASVSNGIKGDICIYVDGTATAQVWWSIALDDFLASSYRPGAYKSLPACGNVDLDSLKASWSATAAQPSVTEVVSTLGNINIGNTKSSAITQTVLSMSTFTPSVIDYTQLTLLTTTNSQGVLTTQTGTLTTRLPVVTSAPPPDAGLSSSDKIALGVGLGIGLPTIGLMILGLCLKCFKTARRG